MGLVTEYEVAEADDFRSPRLGCESKLTRPHCEEIGTIVNLDMIANSVSRVVLCEVPARRCMNLSSFGVIARCWFLGGSSLAKALRRARTKCSR
jgi:hypothetical protein